MIDFLSDNISPAHPEILRALSEANAGPAVPYGADQWSARLNEEFSALFETEAVVIPALTGTAANALSLSAMAGPTDAVYVHAGSHIAHDECNAPEFYTGGAKIFALDGDDCKFNAETLEREAGLEADVHRARPKAASITQVTELGTLYSLAEIRSISAAAKRCGLKLHMDGARFANAVAALGCTPAELTWKAGIDVLSFGGTKNGCLMAEAVVLFGEAGELEPELRRRVKRGGHLLSKGRYAAAQLLAYIKEGLWLRNAAHANEMCRLLDGRFRDAGAEPVRQPEANMAFVLPGALRRESLEAVGHVHGGEGSPVRLCTSWCTSEEDLDQLVESLVAAAKA